MEMIERAAVPSRLGLRSQHFHSLSQRYRTGKQVASSRHPGEHRHSLAGGDRHPGGSQNASQRRRGPHRLPGKAEAPVQVKTQERKPEGSLEPSAPGSLSVPILNPATGSRPCPSGAGVLAASTQCVASSEGEVLGGEKPRFRVEGLSPPKEITLELKVKVCTIKRESPSPVAHSCHQVAH